MPDWRELSHVEGGTLVAPHADPPLPPHRQLAGAQSTAAEFGTTADLIALLGQLPADTPIRVDDGRREDPRVHTYECQERLVYVAWQDPPDPGQDSPAAVALGAFYA